MLKTSQSPLAFSVDRQRPRASFEVLEPRVLLLGTQLDFSEFGPGDELSYRSDAFLDGQSISILADESQSRGAVWAEDPFTFDQHTDFETSFSFRLQGDPFSGLAEGLAFVVLAGETGMDPLFGGDTLGLHDLPARLALEFDARPSNEADPAYQHISLTTSGLIETVEAGFDMADGAPVNVWLQVKPTDSGHSGQADQSIEVFISRTDQKPEAPIIRQRLTTASSPVWFTSEPHPTTAIAGFTASSSGYVSDVLIDQWSLDSTSSSDRTITFAQPFSSFRFDNPFAVPVFLGAPSDVDRAFRVIPRGGLIKPDLVSLDSELLTIPAGEVVARIRGIALAGDALSERFADFELEPVGDTILGPVSQSRLFFSFSAAPAYSMGIRTEILQGVEGGPIVIELTRFRRQSNFNNVTREASVRVELAGAEATAGLDFEADPFPLVAVFPAGALKTQLEIGQALIDSDREGYEQFEIRFSNPDHVWTGGDDVRNGRIADFESDITGFEFDRSVLDVDESIGLAPIVIRRTGDATATTAVRFMTGAFEGETRPGSVAAAGASFGGDFDVVNDLIEFLPGQRTATVWVPIVQDLALETSEYFGAHLLPAYFATDGFDSIPVYIQSDETSFARLIETEFTVNESVGEVRIPIAYASDIAIDSNGIAYATDQQSARGYFDYEPQDTHLPMDAGQGMTYITIAIADDDLHEAQEQFVVRIAPPIWMNWSGPREVTVRIQDNDPVTFDHPAPFDFADVSNWKFNGVATQDSREESLLVVHSADGVIGSAFLNEPLAITPDTSFSVYYQANEGDRIVPSQGLRGGLAFMIQGNGPDALAQWLQGPGINPIRQSFATSYSWGDVWQDGETSFPIAGVSNSSASITRANTWIDYDGTNDALAIYFSDSAEKPEQPSILMPMDLFAMVGDTGWMGFTAGNSDGIFARSEVYEFRFGPLNAPIPNPELDRPFGTLVRFEPNPDAIWEYSGRGTVIGSLRRFSALPGSVSIPFEISGGTNSAEPGGDFVAVSGVIELAPGELRRELTVDLINDLIPESTENLVLDLDGTRFNILIRDDDPSGHYEMGQLPSWFYEYDRPVTINFERFSNLEQSLVFSHSIPNASGSENPLLNVTFDPPVLQPGVTQASVTISPVDDDIENAPGLGLQGGTLVILANEHAIATRSVTIYDDDPYGRFFRDSDFNVLYEGGLRESFTIDRLGNASQSLDLSYAITGTRADTVESLLDVYINPSTLRAGSRQIEVLLAPLDDDIMSFGNFTTSVWFGLDMLANGRVIVSAEYRFNDNDF